MCFFTKWAIPGLFFLYFRLFNTQLTVYNCSILIKKLTKTGFEPWTFVIGSDRSTNWATTTSHLHLNVNQSFNSRLMISNVGLIWTAKQLLMATRIQQDLYSSMLLFHSCCRIDSFDWPLGSVRTKGRIVWTHPNRLMLQVEGSSSCPTCTRCATLSLLYFYLSK